MKAVKSEIPMQVAEVSMTYKRKAGSTQRFQIRESLDTYLILKNLWNQDTIDFIEEFRILLMDRSCHVIASYLVATGGCDGVYVDIKLVFTAALLCKADAIIIAHNHPSGGLMPSHQDDALTHRLVSVGNQLSLPVLDHLIVTTESYYSYADSGKM